MNRAAAVVLALTLLPPASPAGAQRWEIPAAENQARVTFLSRAPMESFEGSTRHVTGHVVLPEDRASGEIDLLVRVAMEHLDTGIELRNRHMRENHLHTDRFPEAVFRGGTVVEGGGPLPPGVDVESVVEGTLDLHGVARDVRVEITWTRGEDGTLHLRSRFGVVLSDHEIPRPQFLLLKLGETQEVTADLRARPAPPPADDDESLRAEPLGR